ncbi:type II secretion system protein GspM, partial [Oleiphilus sp. HI0117]
SLGQNNQGSASKKALNSQQLVSSVTNLAKQQKVALKRFEPSGDNKLKVWVDDASFDKVISWLSRLKSSLGVRVEQISIDKDDAPGKISARMTLSS